VTTEALIAGLYQSRPMLTVAWREAWLRQLRSIRALPEAV